MSSVGPILRMGDEVEGIIAAIREDNPDRAITVADRGAYVRVQGEDEVRVTQETLRRHLRADFQIRSLGAVMASFTGHAVTASDSITWRAIVDRQPAPGEAATPVTQSRVPPIGGRARNRRTFSAFGQVRRMPSEYEIVTEGQNWTVRDGRRTTFEQNASSVGNLWFQAHRDNTRLRADDWNAFRDPAGLTYRAYVTMQADAETKLQGALQAHRAEGTGADLVPNLVRLLGNVFTPSRFLCHGLQQVEAYVGFMAPSPYITSAAAYSTADLLRRVTVIAYRTRELQLALPESGIGSSERSLWEDHDGWQPARRAVEHALVSYDWGEAFTAMNLVLAPTIDDVVLTRVGDCARALGDDLTWLLSAYLAEDSQRRNKWSRALVALALKQRPANSAVLQEWVARWSSMADAAAHGIGTMLEQSQSGPTADEVMQHARHARETLLSGLVDLAGGNDDRRERSQRER